MNRSTPTIIHYIGSGILLSIIAAAVLAWGGKTSPDWLGRVNDVGLGALAGIATGGKLLEKAQKDSEVEV